MQRVIQRPLISVKTVFKLWPRQPRRRLSSGTYSTWRLLPVCLDRLEVLVDHLGPLDLVGRVDPTTKTMLKLKMDPIMIAYLQVGQVDQGRLGLVEPGYRWVLWDLVVLEDRVDLWVLVGSCHRELKQGLLSTRSQVHTRHPLTVIALGSRLSGFAV